MLLNSDATLKETVRYSAYGVPFGIPFGDVDGDGDVDAGDSDQLIEWESSRGYTPQGDLDLDGDIDFTDTAIHGGASGALGRGELSLIGNRKGYAGYEHDGVYQSVCHARDAVLLTDFGRPLKRYESKLSPVDVSTSHGGELSLELRRLRSSERGLTAVPLCTSSLIKCERSFEYIGANTHCSGMSGLVQTLKDEAEKGGACICPTSKRIDSPPCSFISGSGAEGRPYCTLDKLEPGGSDTPFVNSPKCIKLNIGRSEPFAPPLANQSLPWKNDGHGCTITFKFNCQCHIEIREGECDTSRPGGPQSIGNWTPAVEPY